MQPDTSEADLLHGLTPEQRQAVTSEAAPLCILASAGAGKTRVLTRRIAYRSRFGGADARHSVAVTFTRKAAGELQHRLAELGMRERVASGTFHSLASGQLHRWWADRHQHAPALLERKGRLLAPLAGSRPGLAQVPVADLAAQIEWAKARLISPDQFERVVRTEARELPPNVSPSAVAALYARYEDEKRRRGLVDFDDLLLRAAEALEGDPELPAHSAGAGATSTSTSSRTSIPSSTAFCSPGWGYQPTCASSATLTKPSTAGTEPTPICSPRFPPDGRAPGCFDWRPTTGALLA